MMLSLLLYAEDPFWEGTEELENGICTFMFSVRDGNLFWEVSDCIF